MKQYNEEKLKKLRHSGVILKGALDAVYDTVKPGISTLELDRVAENFITGKGGQPCFKDVNGFGFSICTSVNEESIHGKPRADKILYEGDIISIDCGVRWGGMCTDACRTFAVGKISKDAQQLIDVTEQCFWEAIKGLKAGQCVGVIGERIEDFINGYAKKHGVRYSILENYFGHGIGDEVHEDPLVANYRPVRQRVLESSKQKLLERAVICIEPMINQGRKEVVTAKDGWTVITADGKLAAHYENTVIIHKDRVEVITD